MHFLFLVPSLKISLRQIVLDTSLKTKTLVRMKKWRTRHNPSDKLRSPAMSGPIRLSVEDSIARITFDLPGQKVNKLSRAVMQRLGEVLDELEGRNEMGLSKPDLAETDRD